MEWIGCTVCEIGLFAFKVRVTLKLGFGSLKVFENGTIRYFPRYSRIFVENFYPSLYLAPPLGVKPSDLRNGTW